MYSQSHLNKSHAVWHVVRYAVKFIGHFEVAQSHEYTLQVVLVTYSGYTSFHYLSNNT